MREGDLSRSTVKAGTNCGYLALTRDFFHRVFGNEHFLLLAQLPDLLHGYHYRELRDWPACLAFHREGPCP